MATQALSPHGHHVVQIGAKANDVRVREATADDLRGIVQVAKAGDDGNWKVSQVATERLAGARVRATRSGSLSSSDSSTSAPAPQRQRTEGDPRTSADRINDARNATIDAAKDELQAQITGRETADGNDAVTGIRVLGERLTAAMVRHSDATNTFNGANQELANRQEFDEAQARFDQLIAVQQDVIAGDGTKEVKDAAQAEIARLNDIKIAAQIDGAGQPLHREEVHIQRTQQYWEDQQNQYAGAVRQARTALGVGITAANAGIAAVRNAAVLTKAHDALLTQLGRGATFAHVTTEQMMLQVPNGEDPTTGEARFTMVPDSLHQKGVPPVGVVFATIFNGHVVGGVADAMRHAPDAFGGRIAEQVKADLKTGGAVANLGGALENLVRGGSEIRKAAIAQRKINALTAKISAERADGAGDADLEQKELKLRGLRILHSVKVSAATSKMLSAAEKAIKFIQYLADKALVHIKEFFLTVLKYLVPSLKFLQGAVDLISASMAAHRQRVDHSEFATVEREVSNGFKIALAIVNIAMAVFTVVVAVLALALSPILMPALYGGIGIANIVKAGVDLASGYANSGMQAEVFNTWKRITPAIEFAKGEIARLQAKIDSSLETVPA